MFVFMWKSNEFVLFESELSHMKRFFIPRERNVLYH